MRFIPIAKSVIFIQLIIILCLGISLYNKKNNKIITKTFINKNSVQQLPTKELKYFYDLKPNDIATWSTEFIKNPSINKYNNDSLNDTQNYSVNKEPGTYRIITLGDSYTYGLFVNTKDNWTEVLEHKLNEKPVCKNINKFEVINLAVQGYDIPYEVEKYKNIGQKYNPDLIIWPLVDIVRLNEIRIPLTNKCEKENLPDDCFSYGIKKSKQQYGINYISDKQKQSISDLRQIYNKHIFFIDYYASHQKIINNTSNSTTFSDLFTKEYLLKNHSIKEISFPDGHPNELGHQIIADIIFDQLFKTNQIPCESFQ